MTDLKKRKVEGNLDYLALKRVKTPDIQSNINQIIRGSPSQVALPSTCLLDSSIIQLTGHQSEVYSSRFSSDGKYLATASRDKLILLWHVSGLCENHLVLKGHKNAVLQVEWALDNQTLYSASSDQTLGTWDTETGRRLFRYQEHTSHVNALALGTTNTLVSVSDDSTCRIWDTRSKASTAMIQFPCQQTAVAFHQDRHLVFTGGLDNVIKVWDIRTLGDNVTPCWTCPGHSDTLTSLRLDPQGIFLLSNAMDHTVRMWDVRPYAPEQRCIKIFCGAMHGLDRNLIRCDWHQDGAYIASGSFDRHVYIWEVLTCKIKMRLPGHCGTVNEVAFHPTESIIASAGSDAKIYVGIVDNLD